ncbi:MAG: glutathione peroxidase [Deltaproteobacteria bacterium]|nr:glutathione peroxidase [Deltaproteobacteria bacterium]
MPTETATPATPAADWLKTTPLVGLDGQPLPAEAIAGKAVLFVNVASKCGYTPQYEGLQALYTQYKDKGLTIVGVPCNQFGAQEPGSAEEIASFCKLNYGVDFPLLEKQDVNGAARSALYTQLISSPAGGGADVKWNFEKFLVAPSGEVVGRFPSKVAPNDPALAAAIEKVLPQG